MIALDVLVLLVGGIMALAAAHVSLVSVGVLLIVWGVLARFFFEGRRQ